MHSHLQSDFIESFGLDLDGFLTQVSYLPQSNQSKLFKEKLLMTNEKLVNTFEEITHVQKFFANILPLLNRIREDLLQVENNGSNSNLNESLRHYLDV